MLSSWPLGFKGHSANRRESSPAMVPGKLTVRSPFSRVGPFDGASTVAERHVKGSGGRRQAGQFPVIGSQ